MVDSNPIGVGLAICFVMSMLMLFVWMFHVPPILPLPAIKVYGSVQAVRRILVPVVEAIPSERAVEMACRLGNGKQAELVLVHVIVVPFTLPLSAPMPDQEKAAAEALELGRVIAQRHGTHVRTLVLRHRSAVDGLLEVVDKEKVDAVVLGVGVKTRIPGEWGRTSEAILRRASCEVIVDKVQLAAKLIS